jgi:hypothetical protein
MLRRRTATVRQSRGDAHAAAVRLDIDELESGEPKCNPTHRFDLVRIVRPGVSVVTFHPSIDAATEQASKEYDLTDEGWSEATDATSSWRQPERGVLEQDLMPLLQAQGTQCTYERTITFGDFLWDADASRAEVLERDWALIIDASAGTQRIAIQRIRGQIRYWLIVDRDPYANSDQCELGWVASLADAAALCNELLSGAMSVAALKTPRFSGKEWRGDHR